MYDVEQERAAGREELVDSLRFWGSEYDYPIGLMDAAADHIDELETRPWIPVSERLPKPGAFVLATFRNSLGNARVVRAEYSDGHTLQCDNDDWCDEEGYAPAGWYESNEHEECHWRIEDTVEFWMPLPKSPWWEIK